MGIERSTIVIAWCFAVVAIVFLLAPLVVTLAVSFSSSVVFTLPPPQWSTRWYVHAIGKPDLWQAVRTSVAIAGVSTGISMVLGTLCAIALVRGRPPGRDAIVAFLMSPLMLPGLVIGVAMLQFFRGVGLRQPYTELLIAHIVITMPYIVRTVLASLSLFDFSLIDAARTLGLSYPKAIVKVMVPVLAPAYISSGMFAFLASLDNYPVSIFLTDSRTKTLPIQILQYLEEQPDPTIAAISSGLILSTIIVLIVADRLVGIRRLAEV
ncbi:MAG: ABC transporter permease [Hyphomicrobiaceae bacterium]